MKEKVSNYNNIIYETKTAEEQQLALSQQQFLPKLAKLF
jgi:hypothetical protein